MFIDEVKIHVKAGDGGNGCLAFRREKFVPRGGPSGGDGGRGGDITLVSSDHHNTLLHFRFNPEHSAQRGRHGEGSQRTGRDGTSIELPVPVGTVVYDAVTGELIHDFTLAGERFLVAKGGRGGRGNQHFATSTHQAPTEHEPGRPGEEKSLRLELKLLADVGLVGFPNAGKSTLISRISAAVIGTKPQLSDQESLMMSMSTAISASRCLRPMRIGRTTMSWLLSARAITRAAIGGIGVYRSYSKASRS